MFTPAHRRGVGLLAQQALLFVTPEYNRSIPGALKNALDVGSRPYGKSAWAGKPAAVVSALCKPALSVAQNVAAAAGTAAAASSAAAMGRIMAGSRMDACNR